MEYTGFARAWDRVVFIRSRIAIDDRRLADTGVPLEQLAPAEGSTA